MSSLTLAVALIIALAANSAEAAQLATPRLQKAAVSCQKAIAKVTSKVVSAKFAALDACAGAALACVQTKAGRDDCFPKAAQVCSKKLGAVAVAAGKARDKITATKSCAVELRLPDLLSADGLGFGALAGSCQETLNVDVCGGLAPLAACLVENSERGAAGVFGQALPRTGALLALLSDPPVPPVPGLTVYPSCGTCTVSEADRKPVEQCGRALTKATQKLLAGVGARFGVCLQKVYACEQGKASSPECRAAATAACDKEAQKVDAAFETYAAAVGGKCGAVGLDRLLDAAGLGLAALGLECGATPTSLADVAACIGERARCTVAGLAQQVDPNARALVTAGTFGALAPDLAVDCRRVGANAAAVTTGGRAVVSNVGKFLKTVRRPRAGVTGAVSAGGRPSPTFGTGRTVRTLGQPIRVQFGGISKVPFAYRNLAARDGGARVTTAPSLIVTVQRDDLVVQDHFEIPLDVDAGSAAEMVDEIELEYQDVIPGCAFGLALAVRDGAEVSDYTPEIPQVVDPNPLPTPVPSTLVSIADPVTTVLGVNDCNLGSSGLPGSTFRTIFSYAAAAGLVARPVTPVRVGFSFPAGSTGTFFSSGIVSGDGSVGTVTFLHCYRFATANRVDLTLQIIDGSGNPSDVLTTSIAKPGGANAALPAPAAAASAPEPGPLP